MNSPLDKIIAGNLALRAPALRACLKKSHYWLTYDPGKESASLHANHGGGGELLLEIRNVSYETAARLAEELGLEADERSPAPCVWSKWNPKVYLGHDGSADAEAVLAEIRRLDLPCEVNRSARSLYLSVGQGTMQVPMWRRDQLLAEVRSTAERYRKQLETLP